VWWQPLAAFDEVLEIPVFGQRLPGGNLWQPLAAFGSLSNRKSPALLAAFAARGNNLLGSASCL
jgi:hypothetical protein